jgi:hypothetical protein
LTMYMSTREDCRKVLERVSTFDSIFFHPRAANEEPDKVV